MTYSQQTETEPSAAAIITRAALIGVLVMLAGTVPRILIFAANLRLFPRYPGPCR
jgi:hypothetical protein